MLILLRNAQRLCDGRLARAGNPAAHKTNKVSALWELTALL